VHDFTRRSLPLILVFDISVALASGQTDIREYDVRAGDVSDSSRIEQPQRVTVPVINTSADYSRYMRAARLAQILALLQPLKGTVSQYHSEYGEWPSSLEQIDIEPGQLVDGQLLDGVRLGNNGRIIALLSELFGRGRVFVLEPNAVTGGTHTRWECVTNLNMKTYRGPGIPECAQQQHIRTD